MKITRCKLIRKEQLRLLEYFVLEVTARSAADLLGIQPNSAALFYRKLREVIAYHLALKEHEVFDGAVELDESYFGGVRKGKRGRGAAGKVAVFGILKRGGKVYTEIVPDCSRATLQGIIRGRVEPHAVIHSDGWRGYDGLVDIGFDKHFRVHHGENEFANGDRHINGIESFWSYAKRRLAKFNGVPKHTFYLHLKETEYRFNHRRDNIYLEILKLLRNKPL